MDKNKLIAIKPETKKQLDSLKLCEEESYNSLLKRVLPEWMIILKKELNKEEPRKAPPSQNEQPDSN